MRVRKIRDRANLLRRINRSVLRRLGDGNRPRLDVMLVADVMQVFPNSGHRNFTIRRRHGEQLAPDVLLGRRTLRCIDVRRLGADHGLVRLHHALQAEHVRRRPTENQEHLGVFAEDGADSFFRFAGVRVVAVRWNVSDVRGRHRRQDFGMNSRPIVAGERASRIFLSRHQPTITSRSPERQGDRVPLLSSPFPLPSVNGSRDWREPAV